MNFKRTRLIVLAVFFIAVTSFQLPKKIQKKVEKEVKTTFEKTDFSLKPITVSKEINKKLLSKIKDNNFFKIEKDKELLGYAFVDKAPSEFREFDYLVIFSKDLTIKKTKILIYRENHGHEIGTKRWLKQFEGKTQNDTLSYLQNVDAISGATFSVKSMTKAMDNLLRTMKILHEEKILTK